MCRSPKYCSSVPICLPEFQFCNRRWDCPHGEDEGNCTKSKKNEGSGSISNSDSGSDSGSNYDSGSESEDSSESGYVSGSGSGSGSGESDSWKKTENDEDQDHSLENVFKPGLYFTGSSGVNDSLQVG